MDGDSDGYGNETITVHSCFAPEGYVGNANDCNDSEPLAWIDKSELCDGIDNNCDNAVDEGVSNTYYLDADEDGYGNPVIQLDSCSSVENYVLNTYKIIIYSFGCFINSLCFENLFIIRKLFYV